MNGKRIKELAVESGFELAGVARVGPLEDAARYRAWVEAGMAGEMGYMTEARRMAMREEVRRLADWVRFAIVVGKLYNGPEVYSTQFDSVERGWIARYAWGEDYHPLMKDGLRNLAGRIREEAGTEFEWKACVDTAPVLERSWAREAGLGWIGRNTCLIHEGQAGKRGSWYFLGVLLVSLEVEGELGTAAVDRCGSCRRCLDACPTEAFVPAGDGTWRLDSRRCVSYLTIELRDSIPEEFREGVGRHVFGCDICQDVCPWNGSAGVTGEAAFAARNFAPPLERLAELPEQEFKEMFRGTPVSRARYRGFLRNVAVAMGNSGLAKFRPALERLAGCGDEMVEEHARWGLGRLGGPVTLRGGSELSAGSGMKRIPSRDHFP